MQKGYSTTFIVLGILAGLVGVDMAFHNFAYGLGMIAVGLGVVLFCRFSTLRIRRKIPRAAQADSRSSRFLRPIVSATPSVSRYYTLVASLCLHRRRTPRLLLRFGLGRAAGEAGFQSNLSLSRGGYRCSGASVAQGLEQSRCESVTDQWVQYVADEPVELAAKTIQ